jgi:hypothetical protein
MKERQQILGFELVSMWQPNQKRGFLKRLLRAVARLFGRRSRRGEEVEEPTLPTIEF